MTLSVDLFFSFRSPYSYLALPRVLKLVADYDLDLNLRPVYPLAVRRGLDWAILRHRGLCRASGVAFPAAGREDGSAMTALQSDGANWLVVMDNQLNSRDGKDAVQVFILRQKGFFFAQRPHEFVAQAL